MFTPYESFPILTRNADGRGHVKTKVTIDWEGISVDQLRILARNSLIHDLQVRIRDKVIKGPDAQSVYIVARNEVHEPNLARLKLMPKREKAEIDAVISDKLGELLKNLSPEELKQLLGE